MKTLGIAAGVVLFTCWAAFAQSDVQCGQTLDAPLRQSAALTIDSRPAGLEIVGTDQEKIRVSCTSNDMENVKQVHLRLSGTSTRSKLTIDGAHLQNGNLHIRIEVPRQVNLSIQMPAGQVNVDDVVGDKDIGLYAGQVTISSAHEWDYKDVDVAVGVGQINASVYGAQKSGFFRVFRNKNPSGEYRLHTRLTTGQVDLVGRKADASAEPQ
jgi:hypothetical protein